MDLFGVAFVVLLGHFWVILLGQLCYLVALAVHMLIPYLVGWQYMPGWHDLLLPVAPGGCRGLRAPLHDLPTGGHVWV